MLADVAVVSSAANLENDATHLSTVLNANIKKCSGKARLIRIAFPPTTESQVACEMAVTTLVHSTANCQFMSVRNRIYFRVDLFYVTISF